jgi:hypothetical protein
MSKTLSVDSVVAAAPEQVSCDLAGEAAILNLKSGVLFWTESDSERASGN